MDRRSSDAAAGPLGMGRRDCVQSPSPRIFLLPRQEGSSQTGNHGTHGRTRKGEVDSDSLFRVFRWIPWSISDPSGAAIGCCWTESAVRICADLGCRGNTAYLRRRTRRTRPSSGSPILCCPLSRRLASSGLRFGMSASEPAVCSCR
jgi:hypothetical protein